MRDIGVHVRLCPSKDGSRLNDVDNTARVTVAITGEVELPYRRGDICQTGGVTFAIQAG